MPDALVNQLEVMLDRRVTRTLPGDRRAAGVGEGTELAQVRPYRIGDDVRHLDASASARTGEPHVRLHVPERTTTTWIVLDVSPSMAFGTADRLKADVAEGVATVIGRLAVRRAGAVGLVRFGDGAARITPPRAARPGVVALRRALGEGVLPDGASDPRALENALRLVGRLTTTSGVIAVVSDFRGHEGWLTPLGSLRMRHGVIAVEVTDPRESQLPAAGMLALVDPETGRRLEVDTSRPRLRERFAALEAERRNQLAEDLRAIRVAHLQVSTSGDWLREMGRQLR